MMLYAIETGWKETGTSVRCASSKAGLIQRSDQNDFVSDFGLASDLGFESEALDSESVSGRWTFFRRFPVSLRVKRSIF